jgi:hypothetical protein
MSMVLPQRLGQVDPIAARDQAGRAGATLAREAALLTAVAPAEQVAQAVVLAEQVAAPAEQAVPAVAQAARAVSARPW